MSGRPPETEPKPFGKVVITRSKKLRPVTPHDRFAVADAPQDGDAPARAYTGKLAYVLRALEPLHIGSGVYDLDEKNEPTRGLLTVAGKPVVPGSSLKGVVRSIAEALSDSCVRLTSRSVEPRLTKGDDVKGCRLATRKEGIPKLCVCCSLFGGLGYFGRVSFSDAPLTRGTVGTHHIRSPYPPRDSGGSYKDPQGRYNGRKFYYHGIPTAAVETTGEPYRVVRKGGEFAGVCAFTSLSAAEFCLLLVAMGILDDFMIKVGGGKQAMLGTVEVMPTRLELLDAKASFEDFDGGVEVVESDIVTYLLDAVGSHNGLINEDALDQLMQIWEYPSNHHAPTGVY